MQPLKIRDIREWFIENRTEYQKLKAQKFPPFDNEFYFMYGQLHAFISYYPYKHKCEKALKDLKEILNYDFSELIKWIKINEILGNKLFGFDTEYFNWKEDVNDELIKIHEGLYTEKTPFVNFICFCKVFCHLYWNNELHEREATEQEKTEILKELINIIDEFYFDDKPK